MVWERVSEEECERRVDEFLARDPVTDPKIKYKELDARHELDVRFGYQPGIYRTHLIVALKDYYDACYDAQPLNCHATGMSFDMHHPLESGWPVLIKVTLAMKLAARECFPARA